MENQGPLCLGWVPDVRGHGSLRALEVKLLPPNVVGRESEKERIYTLRRNPFSKEVPSCEVALPSLSQNSLISKDPFLQFYTPSSDQVWQLRN